jgi:hypothetical protein
MGRVGPAEPARGAPHLALYARVPRAGAVKTRLIPLLTAAGALDLHRAFILDSLVLLRSARAAGARPVVAFSEAWEPDPGDPIAAAIAGMMRLPQVGGDLGVRLEATLAALAAGPADRVVVIGSDSPDLPAAFVSRAFAALERDALAIGPAPDGGFHLIGSRSPIPGLLAEVAWGTERALHDVRSAAARRGIPTAILEPWPDVDRPDDLRALAARLAREPGAAPASAALIARLVREGRLPPPG